MPDGADEYSLFGGGDEEQADMLDQCCPKLSWSERLIGWGVCLGLSMLFNVVAFLTLFKDGTTFGILYIIGELFGLAGSFFLSQPASQARDMCKDCLLYTSPSPRDS
eukprot:TRINITY_DN17348_c0_g1_i3.p1 TRINITY_DN17348_c0_g1~~TRINITY_DN17348_c0_g1_i3.p1  ORF type:complete len:107 (+),score=40.01 TRINITY_DN17348_c0_g1_i3:203-523(+)